MVFDGWLLGNFSWIWVWWDGMLDVIIIILRDSGIFICIVFNVVGEVMVFVEVCVVFLFLMVFLLVVLLFFIEFGFFDIVMLG